MKDFLISKVEEKIILGNNEVFVVAEISANHGNSIEIIKESILKAKEIGCDGVKIQTYTADTITLDCENDIFKINNGTQWDGRSLYELYKEGSFPWVWHEELFKYAKEVGIILFSTPFDFSAVDLLEKCKNPIYKLASFEITDIPLIKYIAEKDKPVIISTGIATELEIKEAVETCFSVGNKDVYLLKCTSEYPAKIEDSNIRTMVDMKKRFKVEVGLSDHVKINEASFAAVALGAKIIEKHFILDKNIKSIDKSFSLNPKEFEMLIKGIRNITNSLGEVNYQLSEKTLKSRKFARSLFIVKDVKYGDILDENNIRSIRPSDGISPKYLNSIVGEKFSGNYKRGTPLKMEMIEVNNDNFKKNM